MGLRSAPGFGPFGSVKGANFTGVSPQVTSPIHHVLSTAVITTLNPPQANLGFFGPVFLIASSVFGWTTSGNIAGVPGTTVVAGRAYQFIYDKSLGKWYPSSY